MSIRDFARIGLLWLNRGHWDGVQVIPASYFDLIDNQVPLGTPTSSSDGAESWDLGSFGGGDNQAAAGAGRYGMNFWVNTNNIWPSAPANVYHAAGHGGQKTCWIVPDMNLVVAGLGGAELGSNQAIGLIIEADTAQAVDDASWGR
jgi:CubicO group peptidase (beta-lactamase class C family)